MNKTKTTATTDNNRTEKALFSERGKCMSLPVQRLKSELHQGFRL